ncbi:MAG: hydantoinase B/oxoprolinase family protein [SAR324 cluster bacterium]|nr:hydantoinase B/oxoprolinase family protein [SAR324 cluster bacterium]
MANSFRFSIDRGGTFTDVYAEVPGEPGFRVVKLLSEDPAHYPDAPREGIRRILEEVTGHPYPKEGFVSSDIDWIRMGTTVATNALLERKGAKTLLVITKGFGDLLQIGNQNRPRIFDLEIRKPELLYQQVLEVDERVRLRRADDLHPGIVGTTGEEFLILEKPNLEKVCNSLEEAKQAGIKAVAVVFLHAYAFPQHEQDVGALARELGFTQVSLSHEVMPMVKMVARGDTTMVAAYLTPHIRQYLNSFRSGFSDGLEQSNLFFMQSDGGLTAADRFQGSNAILSGPAGGVVGYALTTDLGKPVIGFDMGGTSTDVSRYGGDWEHTRESETAGVRIQAPQLDIRTVAAGGGSRLFFRQGRFEVGPESAGAHPGPVCYRKQGHLAVTDANLVLGRLHPDYFPQIFGLQENEPLDLAGARTVLQSLTDQINDETASTGQSGWTVEEVALGFLRVANETMIRPIREVSVQRGFDIQEHVLACFGGAGGQHACALARDLGISLVFVHRFAGILSAYGIGLADLTTERQEPAAEVLAQVGDLSPTLPSNLAERLTELSAQAAAELQEQGASSSTLQVQHFLNLSYQGTDTHLMIREPEDGNYALSFRQTYLREYGFELEREILVNDLRVRVISPSPSLQKFKVPPSEGPAEPIDQTRCYFENGWHQTPVFRCELLKAGHQISGPALLLQDTSTIVIELDCRAEISEYGDVLIHVEAPTHREVGITRDPIHLSIFGNLFMSIAEQMGRTLQRTSISTNIKERLDFSCAIFDSTGGLVANAPHLPVHLGAMSEAVRQQVRIQGDNLRPGDVLVTNHPQAGGSHLPDITVITPCWQDGQPLFYVASRGHHADIGGITPGSMPPFSRTLAEEGACLKSFKLVENGIFNEAGITELLEAPARIPRLPGELPIAGTRLLADNISDLKAQVAANQRGIDLIQEMVEHWSLEVVQAYMKHIQDNAEESVRLMLQQLSVGKNLPEVGTIHAVDYLDDGSPICLALTIDRHDGSACFDFAGTGTELWGNLNAPKAVTYSAVLYALRSLIRQDMPLNQGCLNSIKIRIPNGSLLSPSEEAAVVGGNVLTSQRITDVILKAFGACAASQGCMNNLTFGNERFGYYETIGGGAGAGPSWHGQSGVHTHMTNTRITDPEILERRYPVLLREFSIRKGSGGKGEFNGGDGLVRELEFLEKLQVAILSERRSHAPYGMAGGKDGRCGRNLFLRKNGPALNLGGKNEIQAQSQDRFRIETPGGGGWGQVKDS